MNSLKRSVFEAAICRGTINVHILPAHGLDIPEDVALPAMLQYGLDMAKPIPDMDVGHDGVAATLSFSQTPVKTFVPWEAVFAICLPGEDMFVAQWPRTSEKPAPSRLRVV